jgi:TonB-dependent starch-binding outer membrane protein SusC
MKKLLSNLIHWKVNHRAIPLILFLLLSCSYITAQTKVTGVIKDEKGATLPGVNISVVGSNKSVSSDFDGRYGIEVPSDATLLVSYMGFESKKTIVNGQSIINVTLRSSSEDLKEVVIVGYGTMRKSDVTGSVSKVNVADLQKVTTIDASKALQGRVAGVNVI